MHAKNNAAKKGVVLGLTVSAFWFLIYAAFSVAFYYGVQLMQDPDEGFEPGNTLTVSTTVNVSSHGPKSAFIATSCNGRGSYNLAVFCVLALMYTVKYFFSLTGFPWGDDWLDVPGACVPHPGGVCQRPGSSHQGLLCHRAEIQNQLRARWRSEAREDGGQYQVQGSPFPLSGSG